MRRCKRAKAWLTGVGLALAGPALAGPTPEARLTVELPGETPVEIGHFPPVVSLLPDGRLSLSPATFETGRTTLTPSPSSCFSPVLVEASGIWGGAVGPVGTPATGFGGRVGLRGELYAALLGVPLALPPLFELDIGTPAVARRVLGGTPKQPFPLVVSVSFSPWTTATLVLTSTVDGVVVAQPTAGGSASTTTGGVQHILMVSPIHVHHRDSHLVEGVRAEGKFRTHGLIARLSLAIPEPGAGVAQLTVAMVFVGLGRYRGFRRRARPGGRTAPR